jgi:hypothetical protein
VIHVGAGPKMIERVRKKNKQGIGMLNVSLQWLERLLVWLPLPHGQQYHSSCYCLVFLVCPVVVPCCQGSELLEVFLLLANRNAADQVKLARQSRASFYPPLHPHPTLKPISPPHTHPWQRHRERASCSSPELFAVPASSCTSRIRNKKQTSLSHRTICWRNWALKASEFFTKLNGKADVGLHYQISFASPQFCGPKVRESAFFLARNATPRCNRL